MNVLITGATRGIGRELVMRYLARGWCVAALGRSSCRLDAVRREAGDSNERLRTYVADVRDRTAMQRAMAEAIAQIGPLDLIIANAGIADQRLQPELDAEQVEAVLATNFLGVINTFAPAIPGMRARGSGHLVAVSSLAAAQCLPRLSTYGASKAALDHQLEGLYWDLKPYGVHVTTVSPGFVDTEMTQEQGVPERWKMASRTAVDRIMRAIDGKRRRYSFPLWIFLTLRLLSMLPDACKGLVFGHLIEWLFPRPAVKS